MRCFALATGFLALCGAALAQPETPASKFDAADVHKAPRGIRESGLYVHGNRFELHGVTMLRLITSAYGVDEGKVFGGPNWLDTTRFEIVAQAGDRLTPKSYPPMLAALLEERFQLKVRKEDKPEPILALVVSRRGQLKQSATPGEPTCKRTNEDGYLTLTCQAVTMEYLAGILPDNAPNYFNHPVVDKTGLTGQYDVTLKWTSRGQLGGGDADHPTISLLDYLDKQYGIKAEPQTRPATSLVIESVLETPAPNPPGTAEKLPQPVTEFEVAEVRPSKPDTHQNFSIKNGRIDAFAVTLKDLIGFAYNLDDYMLPNAEKWMDSDKFDLIAKTEPDVTEGALESMLRALLAERFHLKSHFEEQSVDVWALTAPKGKTKLKETAGQEHAGCTRTPKDGAFLYSCRNTTLAQLADKLPEVAGAAGYFNNRPMVDMTGLEAAYDFDITWSPPVRVYGTGGRGGAPAGGPSASGVAASAPTGGITIFEAIEKQLGLKLATEKHPMQVVVIDHADRTPTEN